MTKNAWTCLFSLTVLLIPTMAACAIDGAPPDLPSVLSYQGEINLDGSQINGTLEVIDGCLAIADGDETKLIAVNHDQKDQLLKLIEDGDLVVGESVDFSGSMSDSPVTDFDGGVHCPATYRVWILGDVDRNN